ncbi:MAG: flagellar hook capping FlgD N-terminal domain-containing protein [Ignavibacterium sp.]
MVNVITNMVNQTNPNTQAKSVLGKDEFLKLLMTQMKYQDPLNPMEGTEYAAQLAQFSSVEQLTNIQSTLDEMVNSNYLLSQSITNTMSASLIGKGVKLDGGKFEYNSQDEIMLGYNLPQDAKNVKIEIYDSNGRLVKSIENASNQKGDNKLSWDFSDNNGEKVPIGEYTFSVKAKDFNDSDLSVNLFKYGIIDAIKFTDNGTFLVVDSVEYSLADVTEITNLNE